MGYDRINKGYSVKTTMGGFLSGSLWGAVSVVTWFELRKLFVTLLDRLDPNAWAYQWRDYIVLIVLGIIWLICVMLVWNKSESNFVKKRPLMSSIKYSLWSLGVLVVAMAINQFIL